MKLALALGRTVRELVASVDSDELADWEAFDWICPIGGERSDLQAAAICRVIANVNRDPKRKPEPYKLADFLLQHYRPPPTPEEVAAKVKDAMDALRRKR